MAIKILSDKNAIKKMIAFGVQSARVALTEAIIEYGNKYVRIDQGTLKDSSYIHSKPEQGLAIWNTPYAKRMYYTGHPVKDINQQASLMWAEKGVKTNKKELDSIAQNAFIKGMMKK